MSEHKITVDFYNNDNENIKYTFPSKNEVCYRCEGFGTHLTPSIGNHAYSAEEFYESFPEPEDRDEYFRRGGIYDVQCEVCKGKNVIQVIDEEQVETYGSEEDKKMLKAYNDYLEEEARWRAEERAEARMERMMMGDYD